MGAWGRITSLILLGAVAVARPAGGAPPPGEPPAPEAMEDARRAYESGLAATERRDFPEAARQFARADALHPNSTALLSAVKAAALSGDAALVMTLASRADERDLTAADRDVVREARRVHEGGAARVTVQCASECRASIDGEPLPAGVARWVATGAHTVVIQQAGATERREVVLAGGSSVELVATPPSVATPAPGPADPAVPAPAANGRRWPATAPPTASPEPSSAGSSGVSPVWFWIAGGATVALGLGTLASAVDTRNRHEDFLLDGAGADDGRASQTRTNVLFFTTLGLAAGTAALGVFGVDWSTGAGSAAGAEPAAGTGVPSAPGKGP